MACARPVRRALPSVCCQSVTPATAAPSAPTMPTTIALSAAWRTVRCQGQLRLLASSASKTSAVVQAPMGTSVRTGCSGWPSHVPWRKFFTARPAAPPAANAPVTARCRRSSRGAIHSCRSIPSAALSASPANRASLMTLSPALVLLGRLARAFRGRRRARAGGRCRVAVLARLVARRGVELGLVDHRDDVVRAVGVPLQLHVRPLHDELGLAYAQHAALANDSVRDLAVALAHD